jgi:hypothetical protein
VIIFALFDQTRAIFCRRLFLIQITIKRADDMFVSDAFEWRDVAIVARSTTASNARHCQMLLAVRF